MSDVPNSQARIQQEACETTRPTSEALFFALGGAINYCLTQSAKVADCIMSSLDETTFQSLRDTTWVAMDGRDVTGSDYATLVGQTSIPDMRGAFPRGKSNMLFITGGHTSGPGYSSRNPDGDDPIATFVTDRFKAHHHSYNEPNAFVTAAAGTDGPTVYTPVVTVTGNTGTTQTAPMQIIMNFFVKINA